MKQIYQIFCIILVSIGFVSTAQTVAITDTNFLTFLKANYAQTLDVNDRLITTEAAKIKGYFSCANQQIRSIGEIKYFTGINSLDISSNNITELPDLSKLTQLRQLSAYKNLLTALPDLSSNILLQELVVYENKISALPPLNALVNLSYLDVVDNQLTALPELNNCKKMVKLFCNNNAITQLPNIDSLQNLAALDASYNKLKTFPKIDKNIGLQTVNLNDNELHTLDNLPILPNLKKMWLYDNWLNFTELNKLKVYTNFKSLFAVFPQNSNPVQTIVRVKKNESLLLKTNSVADPLDTNNRYTWYKNGQIISFANVSSYGINKVAFSDSGTYTCSINNLDFPGIVINATSTKVIVDNCIDANQFSTTATEINCEKSGTLKINTPQDNLYEYTLKGLNSGKKQNSTTGYFTGLAETTYTLSITAPNCETANYPYIITIPKEDCTKALITPNNDGNQDNFFFEDKGTVKIFDKRGELIKSMTIPGYWDASSEKGIVPQGIYIVNINNGEKNITISVVY